MRIQPFQLTDYDITKFNSLKSLHDLSLILSADEKSDINFNPGVYIFGTEEVSRRISDVLNEFDVPILGYMDSNPEKQGKHFRGHEIIAPRNVSELVILAAYNMNKLISYVESQFPNNNYLTAWEVLLCFSETKSLPWNNLRHPKYLTPEYIESLEKYAANCLNPEEFWKLVAARHFVGITSGTNVPSHTSEDKYFPEGIVATKSDSIFLDLGAYTGDTILRFFNQPVQGKDERLAIGIEADQSNFIQLLDTKNNYNLNCILMNVAIGDKAELIPFSMQPNSMDSSATFFENNTIIPSITIDEIFEKFEITHVKFDIEGFERFALQGGRASIANQNATWSVSSYHLWDDISVLPSYFDETYIYYCTSHANLPWDTTMHFKRK